MYMLLLMYKKCPVGKRNETVLFAYFAVKKAGSSGVD
jgi:hypothetical protein